MLCNFRFHVLCYLIATYLFSVFAMSVMALSLRFRLLWLLGQGANCAAAEYSRLRVRKLETHLHALILKDCVVHSCLRTLGRLYC